VFQKNYTEFKES